MGSIFTRRVRIKLFGGNDQTFYPGAQVAGLVEYKSPSDDKLFSLVIDFRGVTKVLPRKGSKIREEHIELFHITEVLLSQPISIEQRKPYTWGFTFTLPFQTGRDLSGKYSGGSTLLFEEQPHDLPPSLGVDQSKEVRIEYQMYAVAERPLGGVGVYRERHPALAVDNIESLRYTPEIPSSEPEVAQEYRQDVKVYPLKKRKFSFKDSDMADYSQQPSARFTIVTSVLPTIALGDDIPILYTIHHSMGLGNIEEAGRPNHYTHKLMSLTLRAHTHRRTALTPHTSSLTETKAKRFTLEQGSGDALQGFSANFSTKAITDWPPSFKSYSIARAYNLLLEITVTDGKQDFEVKFETPVNVVKCASRETLAARIASTVPPLLPYTEPRREDEELPPYQR